MRLGDMTLNQIAEMCGAFHYCDQCALGDDDGGCILRKHLPPFQNLDMEVNVNETLAPSTEKRKY